MRPNCVLAKMCILQEEREEREVEEERERGMEPREEEREQRIREDGKSGEVCRQNTCTFASATFSCNHI